MREFTIQAELLVRPSMDLGKVLTYYRGIKRNLPRRPQLGPDQLCLPIEASDRLRAAGYHGSFPHVVGYDYGAPEELLRDLDALARKRVSGMLFVKGEHPFKSGGLTTLQMLEAAKKFCREKKIQIAAGGKIPRTEEEIKREIVYLEEKIKAGARIILTQPVHDLGLFSLYCNLFLTGRPNDFMPLSAYASFRPGIALWTSANSARFWTKLLNDVYISEQDLQALAKAETVDVGLEIAKRKIRAVVEAGFFGGLMIYPFSKGSYVHLPELVDYALGLLRKSLVEELRQGQISKPDILAAFAKIPRHWFIPEAGWAEGYVDNAVEIDCGQTISQPHIIAYMLENLQLTGQEKVLEVGTGSGYLTALLAEVVPPENIFTIERIASLSDKAKTLLSQLGYGAINFQAGDGSIGWRGELKFDRIIVSAAAPAIPLSLLNQLADGGRMLIPVNEQPGLDNLTLIERKGEKIITTQLMSCHFVPLVGEEGWPELALLESLLKK